MSKGGPEPFERGRTARDPGPDVDRTEALRERLFGNAVGALELYTIYLGERLGLYRALAESGAATSSRTYRTHWNQRTVRAGVA
jgi:hypothetical protein